MTWVWRDGKIVEKTVEVHPARSYVPCPYVIRDVLAEPLQHQANGRWYDSKRAMEKADREASVVCVGNEAPKRQVPDQLPPVRDDIVEAYQKVKQGYKPVEVIERNVPTESGWYE